MQKGRSIDELWRVAEGKWRYDDYRNKVARGLLGDRYDMPRPAPPPPAAPQTPPTAAATAATPQTAPPPSAPPSKQQAPQQQELGPIPDDLLGVMAYVLWERAGKPQGADFSNDARRDIESRVAGGATYLSIAADLKYTPKWTSNVVPTGGDKQGRSSSGGGGVAAPPAPPKTPEPVQVGKPLGAPKRDPLQMIKVWCTWELACVCMCVLWGQRAAWVGCSDPHQTHS
jgi:alpha-glucan,water dikinase